MRKILVGLTLFISLFAFKTYAQTLDVLFFYSDACPHCAKEEVFLDKLEKKYLELNIQRYEVTNNKDNQELFRETAHRLNQLATSVPFTVINDQVIVGYGSDRTTGKQIEDTIKSALGKNGEISATHKLNIPIINKEVELENISLPVLTILMGTLDGFNPCAMWVLLFLLSMLLGSGDKKRMWVLGASFILTSSVIYFLFLSAWLNIFLFLGYASILKLIIGAVALYMGLRYLDEYRKKVTGCEVSENEKRQRLFGRIKKIIARNNIALALIGIVLLAITVNFVELLCSAGLPAVYTQILIHSNISSVSHYAYLLLYILFFMIDDLIVFAIAMVTMKTVGISSKYTHMSHLIGGILMIIIGIIMLFKPELLMFG